MADEIKLKAPTVEQQVNVVINGEEKLKSFASTLENISSNKNLQKYWKDQKQLIEDVSNAYGNFTKNASKNNALELMKTTNALRALSDVDISSLIPDFKNFSQALESAKNIAGSLDSAFSVNSFKDAFSSFETLRAYGVDLQELFKHFEFNADVDRLVTDLNSANEAVTNLKSKVAQLEDKLLESESGNGIRVVREECENLRWEIERIRDEAAETFSAFLTSNNINAGSYQYEEFFERIREGSLTAQEAIAEFKRDYSYLLEGGASFDTTQLQDFSRRLDDVLKRITDVSEKIDYISSNGVRVSDFGGSGSGNFEELANVVNQIENTNINGSASAIYESLSKILTAIKEIGQCDTDNLYHLYSTIRNLAQLNDLKVNKASLDNLADCLERICRIDNSSALTNLSLVNFKNFNDLHISKASLNNLAEYLPQISNIDVGTLTALASLDFDKLNSLHIDKDSMKNLFSFVEGLRNATGLTDFTTENKNVESSADASTGSLKTEAELMESIATNAEKAAKAKKEFVEANKELAKATETSSTALSKENSELGEMGNKSNISSGNSENKALLEGEEIRKNLYKINSEIGMSEKDFISQLRKENEEIQKGNREFQERLTLLKDGKVVASYFGSKASMNIHSSDLDTAFDKVIHSHSPLEGSSVPSFEDLDLIFGKYKSDIKEFVLFYNNEMRSLQAPGDMSLLGSNFRDYGKFLDAISSLTSDSNVYSNYVNNYLASIAEEAGVAYKQVDKLGNVINSKRINTSDWEIIVDVMRQLTNIHRVENQDEVFRQIAEKGKGLSNTFIESKGAVEQFEVSVESLEKVLINLWKSVENDGGKTAFKQLQEQLVSLSSDDIKNILYGDEMFYDANGEADELKAVAEKIYNTYYLPLINAEKELQSAQSSTPMKDTFQGETEASEMGKVATAVDKAVQAKKDFATANEGVQASVDGSKSKLELETELMERLAKSAREAADAKKKFVESNKQVDKGAKKSSDSIKDERTHLDKISDMVTNYRKSLKDLSAVPDADHRFASFESLLNDLNIAITELENHQTILKNKDFVSKDDIVKTNELSNNITTLIETIKKIPKSERGFTDLGVSKMAEKIHSILEENPRLSRKAKEEIRAYYKELTTGNPTKPLNEIYDAVNRIIQKEREAGRAGKGFLDIFNNKLLYEGAAKLAGYFLSFTDFIRYAQDGFETIKEYDKALTEMNKVSNETINALKEFQQESFKTAESIGTTAIAIQNSTAGWMKLGYSLKDSAKLSEWSNIYANVGDMGIEEATEHMVSSVKAWSSEFANDIEASEAIVDRYNHIGNSYAITSAEIGEAMEISAAALKAGGNSLNESLGLIVSGNLIQQDASTTSSALKILSLRIRGAKAELEEMQESTEGLADSSSKMREEIQALTGVDIMLDEDTFKSTAQIIKEIGAVWDSMSDVSQAATLEKISGKNRASTVAGLIENYEIIDDVIKSAEEAQGSALKENQRYVESIEGSLNRLSSAWDKLWVNENNREVITFFIDLAKSILGVIDNIGLLNTAIIGIGLFAGIKNVGEGKMYPFIVLNSQQQYVFFRIRKFSYCQ